MRNLSFSLTTQQVRDSYALVARGERPLKDVTRRRGTWWAKVLKMGDILCAVEKSQGIAKGGLVRLGTICVASVRVENLWPLSAEECVREGFPDLTPSEFALMFMGHMGGTADQLVTRIEFVYVEEAPRG